MTAHDERRFFETPTLGTQEGWLQRQRKPSSWTLPRLQYGITVIISIQLAAITILLGVIVSRLP